MHPNHQQNRPKKELSPRERQEVCTGGMWQNRCPEYSPTTTQCRACGCFVNAKVKLATEKCPLGKW